MPKSEIKNTFTGGRMNKDLDERLITTGEYRDAMNVQVTTSDGSDVGSLHNIMGNTQVSSIDNSDDAICIGSISDEKVNKLYWMVEGLGTWNQGLSEYYKADAIAEYDTTTVNPVVVDVYRFHTNQIAFNPARLDRVFINNQSTIWNNIVLNAHNVIGMTAIAHDISGAQIGTFIITNIDTTLRSITFDNDPDQSATVSFTFESSQRALNFNKSYLITGINIIEKQLFWTDDNSEPKRIHIERYRDIGSTAFDVHSFTPTRDFTQTQLAYINTFPLLEEHITVIRQKPLAAPQLLMDNSTGEGITEGEIINGIDNNGDPINSITTYKEGDTGWIDFSIAPDFQIGNILILTSVITKTMRVKVIAIDNNAPVPSLVAFKVEILSADPTITVTDIDWHAELEQDPPMFEFKFPRFATRYKYEDNEYSAFSPFSEVAFLPDRPGGSDFDFVASKGYNIGMTNQIRKLALKDFIPEKDLLPDDVIEIDILYKESNSPNIYSILTIKPDEKAWQTRVTYTGNRTNTTQYPYNFSGVKGYLPIESEMVHGILPENQLLRPWDNVPRKAKAQEVSGNRLIYGNYLQNYNLIDTGDNTITPSITVGTRHYNVSKYDEDLSPEQIYPTDSYKYSPSKSIKSLRTYQLGITYVDKYGRETPVLTDNNEKQVSTYLNEWYSDKQVKITGQVNNTPPDWAEYQKFFIKETSSEYYNLALDRWYDAEDGNIWLSFPSSERNKVDIDTYLILKKEHDTDNPILEEARYDILAIENEAPDFIKTISIPIGTAVDDTTASSAANGSTGNTFGPNGGTGFPQENTRFVELNEDNFESTIVWDTQQVKENIFVKFKFGNLYTNEYEITNVTHNSTQTPNGVYRLDLLSEMKTDANLLTNDPSDPWNQKRSPITAEFVQKRIDNKPEFDGRFFVKIYGDSIIREKVAKAFSSTEYAVTQSYQVQYINAFMNNERNPFNPSNAANSSIQTQYGPWYAWGSTNYTPTSHSGTIRYYHNINYYDSSTSFGTVGDGRNFWQKFADETSNWFIDENRGFKHVDTSNHIMTDGRPAAWDSPHSHSNINPGGSSENKYSSGIGPSKGINISKDRIHLSWSGLKDDPDKMGMNNWADDYVLQLRWINALTTTGTYWMWEEDPDQTVYVTTNTTSGSYENFKNVIRYDVLSSTVLYTLEDDHDAGWNKRTRWTIYAKAKDTGGGLGSGPHNYLPTNDPTNPPHFDNNNDVITDYPTGATSSGLLPSAPGIRQDGMANALTDGNANTIPPLKTWNATVSSNSSVSDAPGSVTWHIVEPTQLTTLKYSSHNPAIFETEPKENLDLEIYHEVGQIYPLEYSAKTNELYTPVGSVVECWRPDNTPWVLNNPTWNPTSGGYPGTDPIPVSNINIGGNPSQASFLNPWVGPIIVSDAQDDTVILVDDSGAAFNSNTNWPEVHIVPGDYLKFIRPDGSSTSAIVTTISGNVYTLDTNISNRTMVLPWFNSYSFGNGVESNRIRDDYNQVTIDKGPKVSSILDEPYKEERRSSGLIYSGIYNSMSGVNNLNQFIQAEKITKDLNPTFGSIQKLFQRHINLITFCEDKVVKILSNKDALYNADGNSQVTATSRVLGDSQPYIGDFGISKNPESFASENYRAYFTDKQRGVALRLSRDGLSPISDHGMVDWFRDKLPLSDRLIGGFDIQKREYNITLPDIAKTLSFREDVRGWVSFKSFIPESSVSLAGKYYTFNKGNAWNHHTNQSHNTFYNVHTPSHVTTVFNTDPKSIKNFQTLNYEGSASRVDQLIEYINPNDNILYTDPDYHNLESNEAGWYVENIHTDMQDGSLNEFIEKEGKWFNYIKGKEIPISSTGKVTSNFDYDPNEFSWQGIGLSSGYSGTQNIGGCLDSNAINYGCATLFNLNSLVPCPNDLPFVDYDDGSCNYGTVLGCLNDPNSYNYGGPGNTNGIFPYVTQDDGSCGGIMGCTDPTMFNYSSTATADCNGDPVGTYATGWNDSPCCEPIVYGCTDPTMFNYDSAANTPCDNNYSGCTTVPQSNIYNTLACTGPFIGSGDSCCAVIVYGCMDDGDTSNSYRGGNTQVTANRPSGWIGTATNYNNTANTNETSSNNNANPCTYVTQVIPPAPAPAPATCTITNAAVNSAGGPLGNINFSYNVSGWSASDLLIYWVDNISASPPVNVLISQTLNAGSGNITTPALSIPISPFGPSQQVQLNITHTTPSGTQTTCSTILTT